MTFLGVFRPAPVVASRGQILSRLDLPHIGDELHDYDWNACSSALCPMTGHPFSERRYLIVPGSRSWRLYIVDTRPDPRAPRLIKEIPPEELLRKTGYSRPHTVHRAPEGIYISTLGGQGRRGDQSVPGIFLLDCETFEIRGQWEMAHNGADGFALDRDFPIALQDGLPAHQIRLEGGDCSTESFCFPSA